MRPRRRLFACLPAAALLLVLSGCGGGVYPVEGQLVWDDDTPAKELAGSHVIFDLPAKKTTARGIVKDDGSFRLTTEKPDDGALPGTYKVLVVEANRKPAVGPDATALAPAVVDSSYADPATSKLQATVEPRRNQIKLTVKRAAKRK